MQPQLISLSRAVRRYLEGVWPSWHEQRGRSLPQLMSRGTCQTSSLFLARALNEEGIAARVAQGNAPNEAEGFFDGHQWHGHAWVVTGTSIIDITADQFGFAAVRVINEADASYREGEIDTASPIAIEQRYLIVEQSWSGWLTVLHKYRLRWATEAEQVTASPSAARGNKHSCQ